MATSKPLSPGSVTEAEHPDASAALEHLNGLAIEAEDFDVVAWLEKNPHALECSFLGVELGSDGMAGKVKAL